jgi:hypothetical protein
MVNATHAPVAETVQPSAAHLALVELFGNMLEAFTGGTSHPMINLVKRLQPSLVRDLASVPEETLRKAARDYSDAFAYIADAGTVPLTPEPEAEAAPTGPSSAEQSGLGVPTAASAPVESEPASEMV